MATINDMGIPGVGTGFLQPKLQNKWRVTFANMAGGVDSTPVSMQAITVSRPHLTHDEVELNRYNSRAWVASRHTWDPMTISLEDDIAGTASNVIQQQLQSQQWIIGAEGQWLASAAEGSLYKFATTISLLDGNEQVVEEWFVEGCWIKEANYNELSYGESAAVKIDLTVRFDNAHQVIGGYTGTNSALGGATRG